MQGKESEGSEDDEKDEDGDEEWKEINTYLIIGYHLQCFNHWGLVSVKI